MARYSSIRSDAAAWAARSDATDRDVALSRLGSQPLDLLRQAAGGQAGVALHRRQRGGEHHCDVPRCGPAQPQSTVTISTGSDVPLSVTVRGSEIGNLPSVAVALLAKISSPLASAAIRAAS